MPRTLTPPSRAVDADVLLPAVAAVAEVAEVKRQNASARPVVAMWMRRPMANTIVVGAAELATNGWLLEVRYPSYVAHLDLDADRDRRVRRDRDDRGDHEVGVGEARVSAAKVPAAALPGTLQCACGRRRDLLAAEDRGRYRPREPIAQRREARLLELLRQPRAAMRAVVRVRGDVLDQSVPRELERIAANLAAETSDQRPRCDRHQDPCIRQRAHHPPVALKRRAALGVSEHNAVALALETDDETLQPCGHLRERRLYQQPSTSAEREPRKLSLVELGEVRDRDLGAGQYFDVHLLLRQPLVQLRCQPGDRAGVVRSAGVHVRGSHHGVDAHGQRGSHQRERVLDRLRAVIDARKRMAMQVDHW